MPFLVVDLPTITFSSGATTSPVVTLLDDADVIGFFNPSSTSALTVQVAPDSTGTTFTNLQFNTSGSSVVLLTSGQALMIPDVAFRQIRLTSTGAVNANVSVAVTRQILV